MTTIDLKDLEVELSRTKKKVNDWARNRQTVASDRRDLHMWKMQDQADKMRQLQSQQTQLTTAADQVRKRLENEQAEVQSLQGACTTVTAEKAAAEKRLSSMSESLQAQQEDYRRRVAALSYDERAKAKKLAYMRKAVDMFSSRLGMKVTQVPDQQAVNFMFTHVDLKDPAREFAFGVRIQGNNTYTVTSCEPMVDDLGTLQANLNSNHNFSAFVKEVRSRFYKLANSS